MPEFPGGGTFFIPVEKKRGFELKHDKRDKKIRQSEIMAFNLEPLKVWVYSHGN